MTTQNSPRSAGAAGDEPRVAIVTGGRGGIGAATVTLLRERGMRVISLQRSGEGEDVVLVDLDDADATRAAIDEVAATHGRIDALVLAAGVKRSGTVGQIDLTTFDEAYRVNVRPLFVCVEAALPHLRRGVMPSIVTVSSASGHAEKGALAYSTSKGAVLTFTRSLALDLIPDGIRVNSVLPGFTVTPMARELPEEKLDAKRAENVSGRLGQPEDVARAIAFLVSSESATVSGTVLDVGHVQGAFVDSRSLSTATER